jgi:hypothetical protein
MHRREFIATLAGAVTATSTLRLRTASAQQAEKVRRVSVLMGLSDSNPEFRGFIAAFVEELARLGWVDGRNVRIEQRSAGLAFSPSKFLKTESDHFDRFEVGLGLATETPNPDFAKSGDPWGIDRRNRS